LLRRPVRGSVAIRRVRKSRRSDRFCSTTTRRARIWTFVRPSLPTRSASMSFSFRRWSFSVTIASSRRRISRGHWASAMRSTGSPTSFAAAARRRVISVSIRPLITPRLAGSAYQRV